MIAPVAYHPAPQRWLNKDSSVQRRRDLHLSTQALGFGVCSPPACMLLGSKPSVRIVGDPVAHTVSLKQQSGRLPCSRRRRSQAPALERPSALLPVPTPIIAGSDINLPACFSFTAVARATSESGRDSSAWVVPPRVGSLETVLFSVAWNRSVAMILVSDTIDRGRNRGVRLLFIHIDFDGSLSRDYPHLPPRPPRSPPDQP